MIHRTAVIKDSEVVNVIMTDDEIPYVQEEGFEYVDSDVASIGDTYAAGKFISPNPPVVEIEPHAD